MNYEKQRRIRMDVSKIKLAIDGVMSPNMEIATIIIALAELQREMALLLYAEDSKNDE